MARIAILTTFQEFMPGYSLTGIVKDQAKMLSRYGNEVHLFVNEKYHGETFPAEVTLQKLIPFTHLKDYHTKNDLTPDHKVIMDKTVEVLRQKFGELGIEFVFTHDFIFSGWNMPYGLACGALGYEQKHLRWLHWIHSTPTAGSDWWDWAQYGPTHKIVYPNKADKIRAAESYRTSVNSVRVIPHIKDMRTMFGFCEGAWEIIDAYPGLMQADIVQVYPAGGDRLTSKRVEEVINIFASFKKMGHSVCLFIANQWANTPRHHDDAVRYYKIAAKLGLEPDVDMIFSSEILNGKIAVGVPFETIRNLMQCANIFIFPTREETYGLVLPEAALASGALCVLNKSLQNQPEISGYKAIYFDFGSYTHTVNHPDPQAFYDGIALICAQRLAENEGIAVRTHFRQNNNLDIMWAKYYAPVLAEARLWL
jgi:glycosyltransferase involved in cell wall biosynthesis